MTDIRNINKILAAVDLGAETERVLSYALWLAGVGGDVAPELDLLYVIDYALTPPSYLSAYLEKEKEREEKELEEWEKRLRGRGVATAHRTALGRLVETFHKSIEEMSADIMVLGYNSHLIRPSSSERLIKSLQVPMLVVRGEKAEKATIGSVAVKRIVFATDFSEPALKAMDTARSLAEAASAEVVVVHVASRQDLEKAVRSCQEPEAETCRRNAVREAEERLASLLSGWEGVEGVVTMGEPYEAINETAKERGADLIIMGARGLSYMKGIVLGSVSESVVKSSPCPVMIIH
ncbi:MAG: universal stress protein [Thermodesulfovibrionales bacterium]|jgi:nucleotide-binding universal stress UspA family protein